MTRFPRYCIFALAAFSNTAAYADFVVKSDPSTGRAPAASQSAVATAVVPDALHVDPADKTPGITPRKVIARPRLIAGFGDQVPLSFACRQIVPKIYKVGYGPGVDSSALVDWKGGQTWPLVLGRAIKPLGLHIAWVGMNPEIRR